MDYLSEVPYTQQESTLTRTNPDLDISRMSMLGDPYKFLNQGIKKTEYYSRFIGISLAFRRR